MKLSAATQDFIVRWGEMASHWGLNRTEAQIHALLFLSPRPIDAEEISNSLSVARSHVSNSLKELQHWGVVRVVRVLGNRRDHFESVMDVWEMFRIVVNEQKRREIDPWVGVLRQAAAATDPADETERHAKRKIAEMLELFETLSAWHSEMDRLPTPVIRNFLRLGGKAVRLLNIKGG